MEQGISNDYFNVGGKPSIEAFFGPHVSLEAALNAVPAALRKVGRKVGIRLPDTNVVKTYVFNDFDDSDSEVRSDLTVASIVPFENTMTFIGGDGNAVQFDDIRVVANDLVFSKDGVALFTTALPDGLAGDLGNVTNNDAYNNLILSLAENFTLNRLDANGNVINNQNYLTFTGRYDAYLLPYNDQATIRQAFPDLEINLGNLEGGPITFEDANVNNIIRNTWFDGDLSIDITPTMLGEISSIPNNTFTGNNNIVKFDEFEFFTGIGTTIFNGMFENCSKLQTIKIPEGITILAGFILDGCDDLTSLGLPSTLTEIESYGLKSAGNITITSKAIVPPNIAGNTFLATTVVRHNVPAQSLSAYKNATNWNNLSSETFATV